MAIKMSGVTMEGNGSFVKSNAPMTVKCNGCGYTEELPSGGMKDKFECPKCKADSFDIDIGEGIWRNPHSIGKVCK